MVDPSLDGSSSPAQAAKAYDSVRDAFSKIGVRTDEQAKAYITMLPSTAILKADVSPATIFDFPLAKVAAKNWRERNRAALLANFDLNVHQERLSHTILRSAGRLKCINELT